MTNKKNNFPWLSIGAGVAAGWWLRRLLQSKYQEMNSSQSASRVSDQEMIQQVFGNYSKEAADFSKQVRKVLEQKLNDIGQTITEIDKAKYKKLLDSALEEVQAEQKVPLEYLPALKAFLLTDFETLRTKLGKTIKAQPASKK